MRRYWPWGCALLSGLLLALSLLPIGLGGLAWVALVPLDLRALVRRTLGEERGLAPTPCSDM